MKMPLQVVIITKVKATKFIAIAAGITLLFSVFTGNALAQRPEPAHDGVRSDEDKREVAEAIEKSDSLIASGKLEEAVESLRTALKEHDHSPLIREKLSTTLYLSGHTEEAIEELQVAISFDPDEFDYQAEIAWLYSISGDYREAIRYARSAIKLDPDKAYPYVVLGFSLGCLGQRQQATEILKKALELEPENGTAYQYLADVLNSDGKTKEALGLYQEALKRDATAAGAYVGLGDCYQKTGEIQKAIEQYKRAVELAPQDATARGKFGFALSKSGDYMGAMRQGMTANSIRLGQYWGQFMGMFVAVWAGIFIFFGTVLGALFMGSRFRPLAGENIVNQFVLVLYRDRPGRFVITDRRLVFIPDMVSRWFGATRVSIQNDQVNSLETQWQGNAGTLSINTNSDNPYLFRMPALVLTPLLKVLEGLNIGKGEAESQQEVSSTVKSEEPKPQEVTPNPIPDDGTETEIDEADGEKFIAASFDFRDSADPQEETVQLRAYPQSEADVSSWEKQAEETDEKDSSNSDDKNVEPPVVSSDTTKE